MHNPNNHGIQPEIADIDNPDDQDRVCSILKCLVDEWGPESVHVSVPTHWWEASNETYSLGQVRLDYVNDNHIGIHVRSIEYNVCIDYEVQLV